MALKSTLQPSLRLLLNRPIWEEKVSSIETTWKSLFSFLDISSKGIKDLPSYFFETVIHPDDRVHFTELITAFFQQQERFTYKVRIKRKNHSYALFECKGKAELVESSYELTLRMKRTSTSKSTVHYPDKSDFFYKETANMTQTGGWMVDAETLEVFWDEQTKKIYDVTCNYRPQFEEVIGFYNPEHQGLLQSAFQKCIEEGIHYDMELQLLRKDGETTWIRTKGKPVYDDDHNIIKARGIIQNIDKQKRKEIKLKESFDIILRQNERLFNFAHIVSHNLRSHSGNFELILGLLDDPDINEKDKQEYTKNLQSVSTNLNEAIAHLNEVVNIYDIQDEKVTINIEDGFLKIKNAIHQIIVGNKVKIFTNFEVKQIDHIPAYLDNILLNLLSNSIKYKHPSRYPEITVSTFIENNKTVLTISDNGLGIDLAKNEHKVFGMYKTFHDNDDARGIGLFMTKSQVEALNGTIEVLSEPDIGSTFKIIF